MKIALDIRPLSVNQAWQGRRFSTPAKTQFERQMALLLPRTPVISPFYRVSYSFHLKHFATTDIDNLQKVPQDCLVRAGIISDDRKIVAAIIHKFPAAKDRMEIEIEGVDHWP